VEASDGRITVADRAELPGKVAGLLDRQ
jgi:hypothetical protein